MHLTRYEGETMTKIRVLLADDHTLVRKGIRALLESQEGLEVVGEAAEGQEAVHKVRQLLPDVVLMDLTMPGLNGLEATRRIKKEFPQVRVLVLTMHKNEEYLREVLPAGASGYVVKQAAPEELIWAIRTVYQGDYFLSPSVSGKGIEEYLRPPEAAGEKEGYDSLTSREREVLQLIAEGHSTREIAERLYLSVKTVETHRSHLMEKLHLHNVAQLTQYAIA
jgi:two-component system response regulator NreC